MAAFYSGRDVKWSVQKAQGLLRLPGRAKFVLSFPFHIALLSF